MKTFGFKAIISEGRECDMKYPKQVFVKDWDVNNDGDIIWAIIQEIKKDEIGEPIKIIRPSFCSIGHVGKWGDD